MNQEVHWVQMEWMRAVKSTEPTSHPVIKVRRAKHRMVHQEVDAGMGSTRACQAEGSSTIPEIGVVARVQTLAADMPTLGRKVARLVWPEVPWVDVHRPQ